MFGAIDAGILMEVAQKERERVAELEKTDEGRAILAHEKAVSDSFRVIPEGAQGYTLQKLERRPDPENPAPPQVRDGFGSCGYLRTFTDELIAHFEKHEDDDVEFKGIPWEVHKTFKPKINSIVHDGNLRTSLVKGYYEHDKKKIEETGLDKIILPAGFPISAKTYIPELEDGDIILVTMNSLYLCRKREGMIYEGNKKDSNE